MCCLIILRVFNKTNKAIHLYEKGRFIFFALNFHRKLSEYGGGVLEFLKETQAKGR